MKERNNDVSMIFKNCHFNSVWPQLFRRIDIKKTSTIEFTTDDKDFIEVDVYLKNSKRVIIIFHGLESSAQNIQILGLAKKFQTAGYDVFCPNFRGCSGKPNRTKWSYHGGDTEQVRFILENILKDRTYDSIGIIGVSMGANMILKYLSEQHTQNIVLYGIAISAPLDMSKTVDTIDGHWLYRNHFLHKYRKKTSQKPKYFPQYSNPKYFRKNIKTMRAYDDKINALAHGFLNADDYYSKASSLAYLTEIKTPTLILSAKDDPFLPDVCYPENINPEFLSYDYPRYGGHVGFALKGKKYYHEEKSLLYANQF